jgi:hypothetical protein
VELSGGVGERRPEHEDEIAESSRLSSRRFALLFAVVALCVLCCDTLPLFDYGCHLARMHVIGFFFALRSAAARGLT